LPNREHYSKQSLHSTLLDQRSVEVNRLVLLDRDGTINVERHYLSSPDQVELLPGAAEGIRRLRQLDLPVIVVTNQSAIGRGMFDLATLDRIHERLCELLDREGTAVDGFYTCPHTAADNCDCRKPASGLATRAAADFRADLSRSFVVGDKFCDIDLGKNISATAILVRTGYGAECTAQQHSAADYVVENLLAAALCIERVLANEVN
jgi:D-glycero-D-manno-heptose 1,7-bisphosphate phosphatase